MKPWDGIENPATFFARNDKYEKQLKEAGYPDQQKQRLAIAITSVKATGEYDAALREWDAKAPTNKNLKNFRKHIIDEFNTHSRQNKSTAKSVHFGIANQAMTEAADAEQEAQETIFAIAEAMQAAQDKQTERMFEMMKTMMQAFSSNQSKLAEALQASQATQNDKMLEMFKAMMQNQGNSQDTPANPNNRNRNTHAKCPNCGMRHAKPEDCWELEANKNKRPANWKPAAERVAAYNAARVKNT